MSGLVAETGCREALGREVHGRAGRGYSDLYTTVELEYLLNQALDKLPEQISSTFRSNRFDGKTYTEIAEEKNISVKTVESYMTKALKHLRVELKDYLPFFIGFLY